MHKAEVIALAHGGSFVCRSLEQESPNSGKKLFVREVIPGEVLIVEPTAEHKNFSEARMLEILLASPERVTPPCPYFSICGGCDLQHINGPFQRELKLEMVKSALLKQAKIEPQLGFELLGADLPYFNYRSRITLHLNLNGELGFFRQGSRDVVDIDACRLARPEINDTLLKLRQFAASLAPLITLVGIELEDRECYVIFYLREEVRLAELSNTPLLDKLKTNFSKLKIFERKKAVFSQPADALGLGHFSQVNAQANQVLIQAVLDAVPESRLIELFAGAGNFSLALARSGKQVTAVELEAELVQLGQQLAQSEKLSGRLSFVKSSAEAFIKRKQSAPCLLLDPPRSGAKEVIAKLDAAAFARIVYVSCSLPTLTRDLKSLLELGYRLEKVQVLDMFPQTHHVETISTLLI